jgi:carbon storage regulator
MTMLVLSRKKDESIVIGGGIEVTVVEIRGSQIRIGI